MKIAVYTIAKNEAQFVQRWVDSAKEADSLHILDTGSTGAAQGDAGLIASNNSSAGYVAITSEL